MIQIRIHCGDGKWMNARVKCLVYVQEIYGIQNVEINNTGGMMGKERRGFASMDKDKQREIASKGGKAAHAKGTAHKWNSKEAQMAGRRGGQATHRKKIAGLSAEPDMVLLGQSHLEGDR